MAAVRPEDQPKLLGHPIGLFILFFTEMWERFSYYGMRGLLKLYMVNYLFVVHRQVFQGNTEVLEEGDPSTTLGWDAIRWLLPDTVQGQASVLYGWYTGLVYLTPLFGGILADRLLGQRRAVIVGGVLMAIGHFVMAAEDWFFPALLLLILGNGAFKPNVSTQVGGLYPEGDPRRDGAFTIFYMGINLGAFLSNLVCGTLAATLGWHWGFGAAGVGMVLGLIVYLLGGRFLPTDEFGKKKQEKEQTEAAAAARAEGPRTLGLTNKEWLGVGALVVLCGLNIVFWAVYEQQGNTMQTWADEQTIWPTILGFTIPSTWFQSLNPLFIFLMAPALDVLWAWQARRGAAWTSVTKMAVGCTILGLSFIVMVIGAQVIGDGKGSLLWPVVTVLLLTVGELYLSPVGLSLVTKVSPTRIVSMMMGMWFLSSFFGNLLSGYIGVIYDVIPRDAFFLLLCGLGVGAGIIMFILARPLKRALGDV